jgi:anti-sigma B factor antagonist
VVTQKELSRQEKRSLFSLAILGVLGGSISSWTWRPAAARLIYSIIEGLFAMPTDLFRLSTVQSANLIELLLPDAIDTVEFDRLNESVLHAIDGKAGEPWILDLSAVTYAGSAVLGLMVNLRQRVREANGQLVLCCLSPRLVEIFQACCMERLFTIKRTRAEALRAAS